MTNREIKYWKKQYHLMYSVWVLTVILMAGAVMNFVVIASNDGKMPVSNFIDSEETKDTHFAFDDSDEIEHSFLADIHQVGRLHYSKGDILVMIGLFGVLFFSVHAGVLANKFKKENKLVTI